MSALFFQKSACHQKDFFKIDHFKASRQKEPGPSYIRVLFDKEPRYMLGSPSTKNQGDFKKRPSSSLCQTARGSGATSKWEYFFFFKKVHTTQRSHEALHGFAQESTRTMLVPAQRDLNKTRLPELNHEVLGGLSVRSPWDTPQGREEV